MVEYLGWVATAVFVASYFCANPTILRAVQMAGAVLWVIYGFFIDASPVIAANALVLGAAAWTAVRTSRSMRKAGAGDERTLELS